MVQSVARLTTDPGVANLESQLGHITFREIDHVIISTVKCLEEKCE